MATKMSPKRYVEYLEKVFQKIKDNEDYVTDLDAVTGDGDHCANLIMGFNKLFEQKAALTVMAFYDLFKTCGMAFMSGVGGSSGVLYGSAYIAAAKAASEWDYMDVSALEVMLKAQLDAIMKRGNAQPGFKTMIDPLYHAYEGLKQATKQGSSEKAAIESMKEGAKQGMMATKEMEAVRGRACYQANKGVGHLDPGAVTMYYQLEALADCMLDQED